jgi:hypothetical protein
MTPAITTPSRTRADRHARPTGAGTAPDYCPVLKKRRHTSYEAAWATVGRLMAVGRSAPPRNVFGPLVAFPCGWCGGFHLGHASRDRPNGD